MINFLIIKKLSIDKTDVRLSYIWRNYEKGAHDKYVFEGAGGHF